MIKCRRCGKELGTVDDYNLFQEGEPLLCREDFVMRNGSVSFKKGNRYSIKSVMNFNDGVEYILVNLRGDDHVLTENDVARYFVTMEIVNFEQNEKDKEF